MLGSVVRRMPIGRTAILLAVVLAAPAGAQPQLPIVTSVGSLVTFPDFYQGRQVIIRGEVQQSGDRATIRSGDLARSLQVVLRGQPPSGLVDLRGELWDVGRMKPDDPRATGYDLARVASPDGRDWPKPGELYVFAVSSSSEAVRATTPTIRSVVLEPERYEGRPLTLRGQYRGRNLFGEVPRAPGITRFDFLIRSTGAAIWVTGVPPRGRDFDFSLDSKLDTERWLEVTGTIRQARGLQWVDATSVRTTSASPENVPTGPALPPPPPAPPPEVVFSIPTQDETEVPITTSVRIQVSRDLDPETLKGHIRASYVGQPVLPGAEGAVALDLTVTFDRGNRAFTIGFVKPLERFRTLKIELLDGILGTDKQPLKRWTLTFSLGGGVEY